MIVDEENNFRVKFSYRIEEDIKPNRSNQSFFSNEVLMGEKASIKSLVYSFSIILWEILHPSQILFHKLNEKVNFDSQKFIEEITKNDNRPPINPNTNPFYIHLLKSGWEKEAKKRPEITCLGESLRYLLYSEKSRWDFKLFLHILNTKCFYLNL